MSYEFNKNLNKPEGNNSVGNGKKKILISYFSRTGYTETLAKSIGNELKSRECSVVFDQIRPNVLYSWLREASRDFPKYPFFGLTLFIPPLRRLYLRHYHQIEEDIQPMQYSNVGEFDRVCIGGPKWATMSYPVARYLQTVRGITGKKTGIFTTFGGPPLNVFEIEMLDYPMTRLIERIGAEVVARSFVSSGYHEPGLMPVFGVISRLRYFKPMEYFTLGSDYANDSIKNFCDDLLK